MRTQPKTQERGTDHAYSLSLVLAILGDPPTRSPLNVLLLLLLLPPPFLLERRIGKCSAPRCHKPWHDGQILQFSNDDLEVAAEAGGEVFLWRPVRPPTAAWVTRESDNMPDVLTHFLNKEGEADMRIPKRNKEDHKRDELWHLMPALRIQEEIDEQLQK